MSLQPVAVSLGYESVEQWLSVLGCQTFQGCVSSLGSASLQKYVSALEFRSLQECVSTLGFSSSHECVLALGFGSSKGCKSSLGYGTSQAGKWSPGPGHINVFDSKSLVLKRSVTIPSSEYLYKILLLFSITTAYIYMMMSKIPFTDMTFKQTRSSPSGQSLKIVVDCL